jgi:hypothetical protein
LPIICHPARTWPRGTSITKLKRFGSILLFIAFLSAALCVAQVTHKPAPALHLIVGIYQIAPGKHLEFLRYVAARDKANAEVGATGSQWYMHLDGDSWDFLNIGPDLTAEQRAAADALLKQRGHTTGFDAAIEMRQFVASHTDTFVTAPSSAEDLLRQATGAASRRAP